MEVTRTLWPLLTTPSAVLETTPSFEREDGVELADPGASSPPLLNISCGNLDTLATLQLRN